MRTILATLAAVSLATGAHAGIAVKIDLDKTNAPISPFIYGQFMEHLGRCINGGAWAEMIVDRKFFFPIADKFDPWGASDDTNWNAGPFRFLKASPWRVLGPESCVTMDTNHPYAGAHSAALHLPGQGYAASISQDGLGFVQGRKYSGHVVFGGDGLTQPALVRVLFAKGKSWTYISETIPADFKSYAFSFTAPVSATNATIEIIGQGSGDLRVGAVSLMPADNINGWRKDVVELLLRLNAPIYRWPGGNFVSGYDWKMGVGDRDRRAPMKNPAWWGIEPNDVGIHEFMDLMNQIHAEAYVALNTGLGNIENAAQEIEYFNGGADTPMGKWRAQNGHPAPYRVRFWAVGNEMYGRWQLGHMAIGEYVLKHNAAADAVWKVDPGAQLVASGNVGPWSRSLLTNCADHMNLLSEHIYVKQKPDVIAHARQLKDEIHRVAEAHRLYRAEIPGLAAKNIRLAMDEWNYWYGDYVYGELGVQYHLKDALGVAEGLHEYFRNSDLFFMANYAQTVNVIGAIKTSTTGACMDSTGLALELYRRRFGTEPLDIFGETGSLDVAAAMTADHALTIAIVNPTDTAQQVAVTFGSLFLKSDADRWLLTGPYPDAANHPDEPPSVAIVEKRVHPQNSTLDAPPFSAVIYRFDVPFLSAN